MFPVVGKKQPVPVHGFKGGWKPKVQLWSNFAGCSAAAGVEWTSRFICKSFLLQNRSSCGSMKLDFGGYICCELISVCKQAFIHKLE